MAALAREAGSPAWVCFAWQRLAGKQLACPALGAGLGTELGNDGGSCR